MKKIVIIDGSHNKQGTTVQLINEFKRGVESVDSQAQIIHYDLLQENILPCRGCGKCTEDQKAERGKCTITDDKGAEIIEEALAADVVVFATPIYEYCVSSTMKRFLERCLPLGKFSFGIVPRKKRTKSKIGVILASSGAPFPFNYLMGIVRYPRFILRLMAKFFGCGKIKMIFAGLMLGSEKMKKKYLNKAFELGKSVAH